MKFDLPIIKAIDSSFCQELQEPIRRVLVIGHGHLSKRQKPLYKHWLKQGVEVHCADTDPTRLDSCLEGIVRHTLPKDRNEIMGKGPNYFDLLCVNNIPELHLATALEYNPHARQIIIQSPLDLNFHLIRKNC